MKIMRPEDPSSIIGKTVDIGNGNRVLVENILIEAPSITTNGTRVRFEGRLVSDDPRFKCYCDTDVATAQEVYRTFKMTPQKVIYNDPATIVIWKDGTKTVVKCTDGDVYNPEVGLAMCVCKKLYDKKYHKFFRYYGPSEETVEEAKRHKAQDFVDAFFKAFFNYTEED